MVFVALDQSSKISGYSIFKDNELIKYGHISSAASTPIEQRLLKLTCLLDELLEEYKFDKLIFEDIQEQGGNVKTFKVLAQVQGAILLWCAAHKIDCKAIFPTVWRKNLKDNYNLTFGKVRVDQKKTAIQFVKKYYNIEATEDECEAICIGTSLLKNSAW